MGRPRKWDEGKFVQHKCLVDKNTSKKYREYLTARQKTCQDDLLEYIQSVASNVIIVKKSGANRSK